MASKATTKQSNGKNHGANQQAIMNEIARLVDASKAGRLSERADLSKVDENSRPLLQGVNEILDAILIPIGKGNRVLAQISSGKIDELIMQTYKGDHENMKVAVNNVATVLQGLQKELGRLTVASRDGQLSERGKADQFKGAYGEIVQGVNTMLDAILLPIGKGNRVLAQVSAGKIDELIAQTYKGDHENMKQAINNVATVLQGLQKELGRLTQASREGQLNERGKADQFKGAYGEIVLGVNTMLDAILLPIGEGNRILAQVSAGKIDELIAQTYKGDHEKMKQAINNVATVLQDLQKEMGRLTQASREGQLTERGKADQFKGAYGEIVSGVNTMLDAILLPIGEGNRVLRQVSVGNLKERVEIACKGDHEKMKNAINETAEAIRKLVDEMSRLSKASADGLLSTRGKPEQFQGSYADVVIGVNTMLDAILQPINEAAAILEKVAARDMTARVKGDYKGDHAKIKVSLNSAVANLDTALSQVAEATEQVSSGSQQISSGPPEPCPGGQRAGIQPRRSLFKSRRCLQ